MILKIEISMNNAAFDNDPAAEAVRILHNLDVAAIHALVIGAYPKGRRIFDINGNKVGIAKIYR